MYVPYVWYLHALRMSAMFVVSMRVVYVMFISVRQVMLCMYGKYVCMLRMCVKFCRLCYVCLICVIFRCAPLCD